MSDATIYLKDYKPSPFTATTVALEFDLHDDHALVSNRMELKRQHAGELRLYGEDLELISVHLDDKPLSEEDYRLEKGAFVMSHCKDDLTLKIVTRIRPDQNTSLSGLYRSNELFCTQCEAQGFRRMTYFLDRPDVLATYTTRISADRKRFPVLLSNGNLQASGDLEGGRHWVLWQDPFKKPCYLFALVAGNLVRVSDQFTTSSGRMVDLHIYVEPGNEEKCTHAMTSLKNAMRWDEEHYGREYDLDIFMIVAVSDFNFGAMENKGLNIFNAKYILARPNTATDQDFADIESVVGHEYFHNWTGNRVTCRDWFQLSLKEGLTVFRDQEFSRDMGSRDVNRITDVKLLRSAQFPEDAGSMAHPVRPESYQQINNFYTPTIYNKGAEVIRMQQTLVSAAGFRRGMDLYFQRHDGHAVTIDDFVAAMEDANKVDLTQFKRWYSQAGTPEVTVKSHYQAGCLQLSFSQSCRATPECQEKLPFHMPIRIALFNKDGKALALKNDVLELREKEQTFRFEGLEERPIVSLLRDFSAPILLHFEMSEEAELALLRFETDGFAKWNAAQNLARTCIKKYEGSAHFKGHIPKALIDAYQHILEDDALDAELCAELLMPPGFEDVAQMSAEIDVANIEGARDAFRRDLGRALFPLLMARYELLWRAEDHAMHGNAYGLRKLRNVCLWLMAKAEMDEEHVLMLCQSQFKGACTMTDQIASLGLLVNCSKSEARQTAIDHFYNQWKHDELVLDKWFAIQASCELPNTLTHVDALLSHPAFNIKNPNKVRALMGSFSQNNPRNFHAADGSGYQFLTEFLLKIDKMNPQVAARLATPYTRWRRLNSKGRALMVAELERLAQANLSADLRELVLKSLV